MPDHDLHPVRAATAECLSDLDLRPEYRSDSDCLVRDFYLLCLQRSSLYRRAVGFFTSHGLATAAKGISALIQGNGQMLLVASPLFDEEDLKAIEKGYLAREDAMIRSLLREIETMPNGLVEDRLGYLAWLIAEKRLEIRIAIPLDDHGRPRHGIYHEKLGIFSDKVGNVVVFTGSPNETAGGLVDNFEAIDVFCSWKDSEARVPRKVQHFERLWRNETPRLSVVRFPEAALRHLLRYRPLKRPMVEPKSWISETLPSFPEKLWAHQVKAIRAWEKHNRRGLLSMATGSGKTLIALVAAQRCPALKHLVIAVPKRALVDQWNQEVKALGEFPKAILVYENSEYWQEKLFYHLRAARGSSISHPVIVIGTLKSLSGSRFDSVLADAELPGDSLLIVDEAHNAGAPSFRKVLRDQYTWRLGMSATPARHFDEEGTQILQSYFGSTVFTYSLGQALSDGHLCPYRYSVYGAHLSDEEFKEYSQLTRLILGSRSPKQRHLTEQTNNVIDGDSKRVKKLLLRRARILKKCESKMAVLKKALSEPSGARGLIYCADHEQLEDVAQVLRQLKITFLPYTSQTPAPSRQSALEALAEYHVPWLVAIDCLDEGVDIPAVDRAILLASSSNKRQFVQRRGRILRKAVGKRMATLIDIIALPPVSAGHEARWMLLGELSRTRQMAEQSINREDALLAVKQCVEQYGVLMTELLSGEGDG